MKSTLLFLTSLFLIGCTSTGNAIFYDKTPPAQEDLKYTIIFEDERQTEEALFVKSNAWFVESFNSAKSVIEYSDKENKIIMGNFTLDFFKDIHYFSVKSSIQVEIKGNRIRIIISNPSLSRTGDVMNGTYSSPQSISVNATSIIIIRENWTPIAESFKKYILSKTEEW